jgi:hypothetical protein
MGIPTALENPMKSVKEYEARLDSRKRITLRDAEFENYHVTTYEDGTIVLEPRILVAPDSLSRNSLRMMDRSVANLEKGVISDPIDPDALLSKRNA